METSCEDERWSSKRRVVDIPLYTSADQPFMPYEAKRQQYIQDDF